MFISEDLKSSRELKCVGENVHWIQDCVELSNGQLIGIFNTTIPLGPGAEGTYLFTQRCSISMSQHTMS